MTGPDFTKPASTPGEQPPFAPPGYGAGAEPTTSGGYGQPAGYGEAPAYGQAPGYGQQSGGVVGPGGEWLGPPLASWFQRVGSYLIDGVLAGVIVALAGLASTQLGNAVNLALLVALGVLNGQGQSPGKRVLGLKLLRVSDGQPIGPGLGIARQFLHILDGLSLLVGFLWPIWDKKKQTFADKIVKSVVVKL